jgi:hypothetical protein
MWRIQGGNTMIGIVEQIRAAYLEYNKAEGRLYTLLDKQINYGEPCDCERPEKIWLRDEDEEQVCFCAFCGGEVGEV